MTEQSQTTDLERKSSSDYLTNRQFPFEQVVDVFYPRFETFVAEHQASLRLPGEATTVYGVYDTKADTFQVIARARTLAVQLGEGQKIGAELRAKYPGVVIFTEDIPMQLGGKR